MRTMVLVAVAVLCSACSGPLCGKVGSKTYCEGEACSPENSGFCVDSHSALKCVAGHAVAYECDVCTTVSSTGASNCAGIRPY